MKLHELEQARVKQQQSDRHFYFDENGVILYPVKGATLIGDGPSAMNKIQGIGNDLSLDPGIGNCGKSGQWVPVGVGQPTVYMKGITVGGSST